jgi:HEAT repeat protein
VRATIAQALSAIGPATDARALLVALEGLADPGLRAVTAAALGRLGAPEALPPLELLARAEATPSLVHATALDGLGPLLAQGEPLVLVRLTQSASYALFEDWVFELFQIAL